MDYFVTRLSTSFLAYSSKRPRGLAPSSVEFLRKIASDVPLLVSFAWLILDLCRLAIVFLLRAEAAYILLIGTAAQVFALYTTASVPPDVSQTTRSTTAKACSAFATHLCVLTALFIQPSVLVWNLSIVAVPWLDCLSRTPNTIVALTALALHTTGIYGVTESQTLLILYGVILYFSVKRITKALSIIAHPRVTKIDRELTDNWQSSKTGDAREGFILCAGKSQQILVTIARGVQPEASRASRTCVTKTGVDPVTILVPTESALSSVKRVFT